MLFTTIKKRTIIIILILILILSCFFALPSLVATAKIYYYTVVIDAGHGGQDGGSVSPYSGVDENHLNLEYAFTLKSMLEEIGIRVIMTRTNLNGLYSILAENKKKDDMKKRQEIIDNSNANLVISIHMNSYPLKSSRGARVFYKDGDTSSFTLATNIQNIFVQNLPNAGKVPLIGDYFILNCSTITSVIIECGFLTNQEEESLLVEKEYQKKLTTCVLYGIVISL